MASNKATFFSSILGSAVIAAVITSIGNSRLEAYKAEQNKELERYKLELQNQNSILNKRMAGYSLLAERFQQFDSEMINYIRILQISSQNPGNKRLIKEARQSWDALSEKMGDLDEARKHDVIAPGLGEEIDTKLLVPISKNLAIVQDQPHQNPMLLEMYGDKLKKAIFEIRKKIKETESKLTL